MTPDPRNPDPRNPVPQAPTGRRWPRIALWTAGLMVGVPVGLVLLAVIGILIAANTGPGRHFIERQTAALTDGTVQVQGVSGRFPDALLIRHIALTDTKGTWLSIDGLSLDWRPTHLLFRTARVDRIAMDRLSIPRLPAGQTDNSGKSSSQGGGLDLGVDIRTIHVGRIDVGPDIAGTAASFALDGQARLAHIAPVLKGVSVATLPDAAITLGLKRLDRDGALALHTAVSRGRLGLHLTADEKAGGFATVAGLAPLDPLQLTLDLEGPRDANRLNFALKAGEISSNINGVVNFLNGKTQLVLTAHAPEMVVRDGIGWHEVALDAHVSGDLHRPVGNGQLIVDRLSAAGTDASRIAVTFDGHEASAGQPALAHLRATLDGLTIPGPRPTLFAAAPITLDLLLHPDDADAPLDVDLSHALLHLVGRVATATPAHGMFDLTVPQLAPLAAIGSVALTGQAGLHGAFALPAHPSGDTSLALDGVVGLTGGQPQAVGLIGPDGRLALRARMGPAQGAAGGRAIRIDSLKVDGQAMHLALSGSQTGGNVLDARLKLAMDDLRRVLPALRGRSDLDLAVAGPMGDLSATAHLDGQLGTSGMPAGPVMLDAVFHHLPTTPQGTIMAQGTVDGAPLSIAADLEQDAQGTRTLDLGHLDWKSASGKGRLTLAAGKAIPLGTLDFQMTRLADLSSVLGQAISGAVVASVRTSDSANAAVPSTVTLHLNGNVSTSAASVRHVALDGSIADPAGAARSDLMLAIDGVAARGVTGNARVTARGPRAALAVTATSALQNLAGAPAALSTAFVLDLPGRAMALRTLQANAKGETVRLLAPARIGFGAAIGVDRLRATVAPPGVGPAQIDIAGSVKPALSLNVAIDNLTPAIARPFMPSLDASGVISARAKLSGTLASPQGTVTLTARDMKYHTDFSGALPAASLDAKAQLAGTQARLDATAHAGSMLDLAVRGTVPTGAAGSMALQADGKIDLSAANAYLGAQGRQAEGMARFALALTGPLSAPRANGTVTLANGQIHDFAQGIQLSNINGSIVAHDDRLTIDRLTAAAGPGQITVSGSVGAFQPGLPIDLRIVAAKARPLASDLVTATIDSDLTVRGLLASRIDVAGSVAIPNAEINIPSSLPTSVARLDVIRPGDDTKAAADAGGGMVVGLDVTASSPGQMFIRGHGLDAEMRGRLHVGGTSDAPLVTGGFTMRRGSFNLAGISLDFTKGRVAFNGTGVTQAIDPTLDFEAERGTNAGTARLTVSGYASAPKISFSSSPPLSQDQIMAMLLFGTDAQSLSPTQMAEIAAAVATLTGGNGFDPIGTVRNTLGLDRLQLAGGSGVGNGSGTSVEAGKYVMRGVYVGAKQATSGSGTQAQVQVDLTRRLKLNTTVGTGGNVTGFTTPENDPGSSVGLSYQFQY
ncbi:translocation/assembly module TamB domain-containing protein [Gluconacetobacter azotocaptans]|uniref:translocation/assembly module TamB domain-containing protein n=1 Tax=Gluconacetobacter azotocaptans TaxID=142834 RepID=UPI00195C837F|nr:translocation/assembly module TamB domain-containing protein [Gluconacetobacter azotocaptans]MBM9400868.1 translocation/assembly module TamB domain-containing protein [Gluconacetobacter azotocaptans]